MAHPMQEVLEIGTAPRADPSASDVSGHYMMRRLSATPGPAFMGRPAAPHLAPDPCLPLPIPHPPLAYSVLDIGPGLVCRLRSLRIRHPEWAQPYIVSRRVSRANCGRRKASDQQTSTRHCRRAGLGRPSKPTAARDPKDRFVRLASCRHGLSGQRTAAPSLGVS